MNLREVQVRPIEPCEEKRYQVLMQEQHYLGAIPKIGETLRYIATWLDQWIALLSFSAAAWKCSARDRWIG
ncbi:MAG: Druantia anti-phage system protein DruA, partial [Thermodesulfobacteriota bacterium]